MKNEKCPNCGANIELGIYKRIVKCEYCKTSIDLNQDLGIAPKLKREMQEVAIKNMKLTIGDREIENPTDDHIRDAIRSIDGQEIPFAILEQDEMTYIQTAGTVQEGFVLEWQEGSLGEHYQSISSSTTAEEIITAFQKYLALDDSWKNAFQWKNIDPKEPEDLSERSDSSGCMTVLIITALSLIWVAQRII